MQGGIAIHQPSPEFVTAVNQALMLAQQSTDEPIAFAAQVVPVYPQRVPDEAQLHAANAAGKILLGLWVDEWQGLPRAEHGIIFLFEEGIRYMPGQMAHQVYLTLLHELDHALQRDHVLDDLNARKAAAYNMQAAAQSYGGCGVCGQ